MGGAFEPRRGHVSLQQRLEFNDATYGDLYRFADHARSAGISEDTLLTVETHDELGNPLDSHMLVSDLGTVDRLSRPVLVDERDAAHYAQALERTMIRESTKDDDEVLGELANLLRGE